MTPTQADREAAAQLYEAFPALSSSHDAALKTAQFIRDGGGDGWSTVLTFARHRLAAEAAAFEKAAAYIEGKHGFHTADHGQQSAMHER